MHVALASALAADLPLPSTDGMLIEHGWWSRGKPYDGLDALSGGLEGHRFLQNVELASNFVHDDGVEDLCRGLLLNNSVCRIGLADNCVGPRGVSALCSCLRTNQTVRDVDLSRNPLIGAEGAAFMGRYLEDRDCRLECLLMSQTTLCAGETDKKGVFGMAQGLK